MVQPPVHGLVFTELTGPSQDGENGDRAVVLEIPPSLDTPHFVFHKSTIRAPRRYGSHTVDMSERDIEQAYRRRFEDRRNNDRGLAGLLEQVLIGVDKGGAPWLVAAARPTRPRPAHTDRISRAEAQTILNELRSHNPFLEGGEGLPGVDINPRPGYRKWRSTDTRSWFDGTVVDIHDDGSVALGLKATQGQDGFAKDTDIHEMQAHTVPAHIIHLVRMVATRMSMAGTFEISISITSPSGGPVYIRTLEMTGSHGFLRDRDELTPILAFQSVTGLVDVHDPDPEVLTTVRNLALDILNQAGSSALSPRYLKKSS
jgi:hypothetical protein